MPRNSTLASVEIDVAEEPREIAHPEPETPFRILVAGNFSGGAGRYRRPIEIDRDNFDAVMERVASIPSSSGMRTSMRTTSGS